MYETFFGLNDRPFSATPEVERFFPGASIELARKKLTRCIERGEGPALVIGPPGIGKTLLLHVLAQQFSANYETVMLSAGHVGGRRGLLQSILHALRQPYRGLDDGELRLAIVGHLIAARNSCEGVLLLVDEAHALSTRLLEELRMLTNVTVGGEACLRLVLAGGGALEELFASPKLETLSQRLAARCYLGALERGETAAYVRRRLSDCGGASSIFSAQAPDAIFRLTDGIPRLVNQVCDHALILAHVAGRREVDAAIVEEAWADLQQLSAPWTASVQEQGAGHLGEQHIVEFGALDGVEEGPDAIPFQSRRSTPTTEQAEERLDESEELLSQLEDDFQPAGSIGPEAEIVIVPDAHPFDEMFAEEEIVIDRYASLDTDLFAGCPVVASVESHDLGVSLAAAARAAEPPTPHAWSKGPRIGVPVSAHADAVAGLTTSLQVGAGETLRAFTAAPEEPRSSTGAIDAPRSAGGGASGRSYASHASVGRQVPVAPSTEEPDDSDMIVFEDEDPTGAMSIRPVQPVRRQEYRQLFAKLRRG